MINYKDELLKAFYEICEKAKREGYENGEANGIDKMNSMVKEAYQSGLEDAWECARQIHDMYYQKLSEVFPDSTHDNIFNDYSAQEAMQKIKEYEQQKQDEKKCEVCEKGISAECVVDECKFEAKQGEKNCINCGQPRDNKNRCIPFIEGKCIEAPTGWIPKHATDIDDGSIKVGDEVYLIDIDRPKVVTYVNNIFAVLCDFCDWGQSGTADVKDLHKTGRHFSQIAEVLEQLRGKNE